MMTEQEPEGRNVGLSAVGISGIHAGEDVKANA